MGNLTKTYELVVSTPLKIMSQNDNLPQISVDINIFETNT